MIQLINMELHYTGKLARITCNHTQRVCQGYG